MKTTSTKPGLSATFASPYTPIGYVNGTPIYPIGGGRGSGIQFAVGPDDADPEFDDDRDEDDDDDEDEPDEEPAPRRTRPASGQRRRQADEPDADEPDADWTPPSREQFDRVQAALKRANSEAARRRTFGKQMEKLGITDGDLGSWLAAHGIDPDNGTLYTDDVVDPDEPDGPDAGRDDREEEPPARRRGESRMNDREVVRQVRAAEQRGRQSTLSQLTPILAQQAAESAMREAGFTGNREQMDRALRMIDARSIDVQIDDDGFDVVGIEEQVDEIRDTFPQLFEREEPRTQRTRSARDGDGPAPRRRRTGAASVDGGDRGRQPRKPLTWLDRAAEQLDQVRR